jgi:hypothetical protein
MVALFASAESLIGSQFCAQLQITPNEIPAVQNGETACWSSFEEITQRQPESAVAHG